MTDLNSVDRPPRIQPDLPINVLDIPAPPNEDPNQAIWKAAIPIITIFGCILFSAVGQAANLLFGIPVASAVFLSTGLTIYNVIYHYRLPLPCRAASAGWSLLYSEYLRSG